MSDPAHVTKVESLDGGAIASCVCGWSRSIMRGDPTGNGRVIASDNDAHGAARAAAAWHRLNATIFKATGE